MRGLLWVGAATLVATLGCEEDDAKPAAETAAVETASARPAAEAPKPKEPPKFLVEAAGPKVGWTAILLEKKDGPEKLASEIASHREHVDGQVVPLEVDRKAKLSWVVAMVSALADTGATGVEIKTDSRPEYPDSIRLTPLSAARAAPSCSVVATVLEERKNAVWHLEGGTAVRSPRGLAGPDMAMTAENLTRAAKGCAKSDTLFFSAHEEVEWGLAYDLAAVSRTLDDVTLDRLVLLPEAPVAGRPVDLETL